jgi:hypothetical protein
MKAGCSGCENEESTSRIGRKDLTEAQTVGRGSGPEDHSQIEKGPARVTPKAKAPEGPGKYAGERRPDRRATRQITHRGGGIVEQFDYLWRNRWP